LFFISFPIIFFSLFNLNNNNIHFSTSSFSNKIKNNENYNIYLIKPTNDYYMKNSEYCSFSKKKEYFKMENLEAILTSLNLNVEKIKNHVIDENLEIKTDKDKLKLFNNPLEDNQNKTCITSMEMNIPENKQKNQVIQVLKNDVYPESLEKGIFSFTLLNIILNIHFYYLIYVLKY